MIKFLFKILLPFFLLTTIAYSEVIEKIIVKGNNRVNYNTILLFGDVNVGDDVTTQKINKILKNLYETNFFDSVQVKLNNSSLEITITEAPLINKVYLSGIKKKNVQKIILERIISQEKSSFNKINIEKDKKLIKGILQQMGYFFPEIETSINEIDGNIVNLFFDINVGKKSFIQKINFTGDKKFKYRKLINIITSEEDKFWKFISTKRYLNEERIKLDVRLLESYYKNKGFFNAKVSSETVQFDENKGGFILTFNIDSGNKFYFNNFIVEYPDDYDQKYFSKINEKLNDYSKSLYSYRILEKILKKIENIASDKQYEFVDAQLLEKISDTDKVDITIKIIESDKKYVERINVFGNNITVEDVIRNQMIVDEGDPLNNILLNKSINNIKGLRIFKTVKYEVVNSESPNQKIININVEEKPTGEISIGAGVGTSGASTAFGVKENNFLGKGIKLDANLQISQDKIKGLFSYTNPNFKNTDRDLIYSIQSTNTDKLENFGFKSNEYGASIGTNFEHLEDFFINPSIEFSHEKIETSSAASSLLKKQEGSYNDLTGSYQLFYDKRNQIFEPTAGFYSRFYQSLPINISENQTIVNQYEVKAFYEYIPNVVGSIAINLRAANSLGDDDVKISDRLSIPRKLLRGFERGKVGPKDGDDYIGGNYMASLNLVSDLPIFEGLENINFHSFYDMANLWGVDYNSSINESNAIRSSFGVGAEWFTPIGPVTFTLAQPISKKDSDKTETFTFNIGTTF